jgi:ubiquinone/menaquinone biosynthesis C-methylase UbiE
VLDFALDTVALKRGSWEAPTRVLDLGSGDGRFAARLAEEGAAVTGLDPSAVALERARAAHPDLEFVAPAADGRLPFEDSSFDVVACLDVLQHVLDTQLLVSEARRVLARGGLLAVAVPWHGRLENVITAVFSFERHYDPLEPVVRFYTPRSLRLLLGQFGFEDVHLEGRGGIPLFRTSLLCRARRG